VESRIKPWQLALITVVVFGAALGILQWWQTTQPRQSDARTLLETLPTDRATVLYIDASTLRKVGILRLIAGSKAAEEPDYRKFVEQTGFDYRTDLDAVAASFTSTDSYFAIRGRFQWPKLEAYAKAQGGECRNSVCNISEAEAPGQANRNFSFYAMRRDVLAIAVNPGPWGVMSVAAGRTKSVTKLPAEPVWISAPGSVAAQISSLPLAVGVLFAPVTRADKITLALGARGLELQVRMEAECASPAIAASVTSQLSKSFMALSEAAAKQDAAKELREWSPIFSAGKLQQHDTHVSGVWPLERRLLEAVAAGGPE